MRVLCWIVSGFLRVSWCLHGLYDDFVRVFVDFHKGLILYRSIGL